MRKTVLPRVWCVMVSRSPSPLLRSPLRVCPLNGRRNIGLMAMLSQCRNWMADHRRRWWAIQRWRFERLIEHPERESPDYAPASAALARLKTGRNEPCQCGSGRKYKKCCLANDEVLVRQADAARRAEASKVSSSSLPAKSLSAPSAPKAREPRQLTETEIKLDALWPAFDALARPTAVQMDELLGNLLVLPPDMTEWNEVIHAFARHDHPELPAVFRRIVAGVPHIKGTGMAFFYWAAAEEFIRKQMVGLLPEVASGFCRLDGGAYDADALAHLEDFLLAAHFDA
jgi:hypothetical protein